MPCSASACCRSRSAFGPTPCSLASSAAGTSASRLSRVYPAAVSARVAGAPILPGRPASRDVMYRIAPVPGPRSRREDVPKTAPHHQPQDALFCCLSSGQADIPDPGSRVGGQAAEVLMRPTSCASMGGTRSTTSGKLRRVFATAGRSRPVPSGLSRIRLVNSPTASVADERLVPAGLADPGPNLGRRSRRFTDLRRKLRDLRERDGLQSFGHVLDMIMLLARNCSRAPSASCPPAYGHPARRVREIPQQPL